MRVNIFLAFLIVWVLDEGVDCVNSNEKFSPKQAKAFSEFKKSVLPILKQEFMKEDVYISKWFIAGKYDARKSENLIKKHLSWRKETNIDKIPDNYFDEFEKNYPYDIEGVDRKGRPVIQWYVDEWDIRAAKISGQAEKLELYVSKLFDKTWDKVRKFREEGKNVTQFGLLVNFANLNKAQHLNPASIPSMLRMAFGYKTHFPWMAAYHCAINTQPSFQTLLNGIKPLLDPETKKVTKFFGPNKNEWRPALDKLIAKEQRTETFGGTRVRD